MGEKPIQSFGGKFELCFFLTMFYEFLGSGRLAETYYGLTSEN